MLFSKSFGYALRGILYVAMVNGTGQKARLDDMAATLGAPRYFLGKVMNRLVKGGVLHSLKGHYGGFYFNDSTVHTSLLKLAELTGEMDQFDACVLRFQSCNSLHPCPLHEEMEPLKEQWKNILLHTTIDHLLKKKVPGFILSIAVA